MELTGITREGAWPRPSALIVSVGSDDVDPFVADVVREDGYDCAILPPEAARTGSAMLGPFAFLIIGPALLRRDDAADLIAALRHQSPSTAVLLIADEQHLDVAILITALRVGVRDVLDPTDHDQIGEILHARIRSRARSSERVLAIGAHPDDVEIGCAGTLLEHRRNGDQITILTMSRGGVGGDTNDRAEESRNTAAAIGAQLFLADLPDASIDPGISTIRLIESVVAEVDPTLVLVHSSHDNHQDHRAVHTATLSATRYVPRVVAYQSPSATGDFKPVVYIPIDDCMDAKVDLLGLFASQHGRAYLEPELVRAGSRYWARQLGKLARYAEPFEAVRGVMNRAPRAWRSSLHSVPAAAKVAG